MITFAGLQADARVLIDKARLECQSFRFTYEDAPSIEYVSRFIAQTQQKYTQKGGVRPFGISTFIAGFEGGVPHFYQTEPSGAMSEWKANAIGKKSKELREYMEKHFKDGLTQDQSVRLGLETMLEVVESAKSIECCVMKPDGTSEMINEQTLDGICKSIEAEKEAAEAAKSKI